MTSCLFSGTLDTLRRSLVEPISDRSAEHSKSEEVPVSYLESLALRLVSDADFCVALDTDPEAALAACDLELDEIEYSILIGLAPVLTAQTSWPLLECAPPVTKQKLVFMGNVHLLAAAYRSATHGPPTGHTCSSSCPLAAASIGGIKNRWIS